MNAPIGIFDSGLGGLTVAAALRDALPHENLIYLGDTARVPYGTRSAATVVRYARHNVAFLRKHGVKLVVVACNTVSAHGLDGLTDGNHIPVLGVIRPGARAAIQASAGGPVAVLGTPGTVRSGAYVQAIHELDPEREVVQIACSLFVPLVEEGWLSHPVTTMVAREYLEPLRGTSVDTIILGCTHYPLLRRAFEAAVAPDVVLLDPAPYVATRLRDWLSRHPGFATPGAGAIRTLSTGDPARFALLGERFLGEPLPLVEHLVDRGGRLERGERQVPAGQVVR